MNYYKERFPHGPIYYIGVLERVDDHGSLAILGPSILAPNSVTHEAIYTFSPPGNDASSQEEPVIDYEWLEQQVGKLIEMHVLFAESSRPFRMYSFTIWDNNGSSSRKDFP